MNVNTGKIAWRSTLGVTDSLPEGKQNTGRPGLGGAIVTASGLIFIGATDDARFRAFDETTGKEIWTVKLPAAAESTPITYADAHGNQYVAVVATGGGLIGAPLLSDAVIAYSFSGSNSLSSVLESRVATQSAPAASTVSGKPYIAVRTGFRPGSLSFLPVPGREEMLRVCSGCHSANCVGLQRMDAKEWNDLVQAMAAVERLLPTKNSMKSPPIWQDLFPGRALQERPLRTNNGILRAGGFPVAERRRILGQKND